MALQGFVESEYLAAKLAALQATETEWVGKDADFLKTVLANAGMTPEEHYEQYGWAEGLAPNSLFNAAEYKLAKAQAMFDAGGYITLDAAQAAFDAAWPYDPYLHYVQYGSAEGVNPSNSFDESSYLDSKLAALQADSATSAEWTGKTSADLLAAFNAAGLSVLGHYQAYGKTEGIAVTVVPDAEQVSSSTSTPGVTGETYTLTSTSNTTTGGLDQVTGTSNNDTVNAFLSQTAAQNTWELTDSIDTGAGNDTLSATVIVGDHGAVTYAGLTASNVEEMVIKTVDGIADGDTDTASIDVTNISATTFTVAGGTASAADGIILTGVTATDTVAVTNSDSDLTIAVDYTDSGLTGSADTVAMSLGGKAADLSFDDGVETLALTTIADSTITLFDMNSGGGAATVKSVTVGGSSALTATWEAHATNAQFLTGNDLSVDGSSATGALTLDLDTNVTAFGGAASTTFTLKGGASTADTVKFDVDQALSSSFLTVSGFETVMLNSTNAAASIDGDSLTGATTIAVEVGTAAISLTDVASGTAIRLTGDKNTGQAALDLVSDVSVAIKDATSSKPASSLAITVDNSGTSLDNGSTDNAMTTGTVTANNVQAITINAQDNDVVMDGLSADKLATLTNTAAEDLTINGTIGAAATTTAIDNAAVQGTFTGTIVADLLAGNKATDNEVSTSFTYTGAAGKDIVTISDQNANLTGTNVALTLNVDTGAGNDNVTLNDVGNTNNEQVAKIDLGAGDDTLTVATGGSLFGTGSHSLAFGEGDDTISVSTGSADWDNASISGLENIVVNGAGDVRIALSNFDTNGTNDIAVTVSTFSTGRAVFVAGSGNDTLTSASITGAGSNDITLLGASGAIGIDGGAGNDTITDTAGDDLIIGGAGADVLNLTTGGADDVAYSSSTDGGLSVVTITATGTAADDFTATAGTTVDDINGFTTTSDEVRISGALRTALNSTNDSVNGTDDTAILLGDDGNIDLDTGTVFIFHTDDDLIGDDFGDVSAIADVWNTTNGGTPANFTANQEVIFAVGNDSGNAYGIYWFKDVDGNGDISVGDQISLLGITDAAALAATDFAFLG